MFGKGECKKNSGPIFTELKMLQILNKKYHTKYYKTSTIRF